MPRVAFVFPGQGAQYVGMGCELARVFPEARAVFEAAKGALGYDIASLCFAGPETDLARTVNTQPAVLTTSVACLEVLRKRGLQPDVAAGLSLGEYSALVAAGAMTFVDAVRVVRRRGELMEEAVAPGTGAMAAIIGLDRQLVASLCAEGGKSGVVEPANFNCPGQVVISGERAAVEKTAELARAAGAKNVVMLAVSGPFHSSLLGPVVEKLRQELARTPVEDARIPVVANVSARYVRTRDEIREALATQVGRPVLWEDSVRTLLADGVRTFVEVGPGKVLSGFLRKIDREATALNVEDPASLERVLDRWGEVC